MFCLTYVTMNIKKSSCGSNAGMETSAPLINAFVNNPLFHFNSRINQILPQIIHILRFFLLYSLPHILK